VVRFRCYCFWGLGKELEKIMRRVSRPFLGHMWAIPLHISPVHSASATRAGRSVVQAAPPPVLLGFAGRLGKARDCGLGPNVREGATSGGIVSGPDFYNCYAIGCPVGSVWGWVHTVWCLARRAGLAALVNSLTWVLRAFCLDLFSGVRGPPVAPC